MKRKLLKAVGWTAAVLVLLFLAVLGSADLWAPSVMKPLLAHYGANVEQIDRADGHYFLREVTYADDSMQAEIAELQMPTLWRLVAKRWLGRDSEAVVIVNKGQLTLLPGVDDVPAEDDSESSSLPELAQMGLEYWTLAFQWVDFVEAREFKIATEPDAEPIPLDLSLNGEKLNLMVLDVPGVEINDRALGEIELAVNREAEALRVTLSVPSLEVRSEAGIRVGGEIDADGWLSLGKETNRLNFAATIGAEGYIPTQAKANAKGFVLPADLAELPDYQQPAINLTANWDGATAEIELDANAAAKKPDLPPLKVTLHASGDDEVVNVDQLNAEAWSSKVALSKPVRVELNNLQDLPDAELTVDLNLSDIPEQKLDGRLQGALVVDHQPNEGWPLITADFAGQSLRYDNFVLQSLDFRAQLEYPQLTIEAMNASTGEGTKLTVTGKADVEEHHVESIKLDLVADPKFLKALEPLIGEQELDYETIELTVDINGHIDSPTHGGSLRVGNLKHQKKPPAHLTMDWEADWLDFSHLAIGLKNDRSAIDLVASASLGGPVRTVDVEKLRLDVREQPELNLAAPFTVTVGEEGIRVSSMQLNSEAGGMISLVADVDYPRAGKAQVQARDVSAVWLDLVLEEPLPYVVKLDELTVDAQWDEGPLQAKLKLDAGLVPEDQDELELIADLTLGEGILAIPDLHVAQGEYMLVEAKGEAPLVITPAGPKYWEIEPDEPIDFKLKAAPDDSPVWTWLERSLDLDFIEPVVDFQVSGDIDAPEGMIDIRFAALEAMADSERKLPRVQQAEIVIDLSPDQFAVTKGQVNIAGQPLTLVGQLPMGRKAWEALIEDGQVPDWSGATGDLRFTDVPLNSFEDWLPDVLRNEGSLSLTAKLSEGEQIEGALDIEGVKTRPLAQLGSVNDINASFRMNGRTLTVKQAEGVVGGAPIGITGTVNLDLQWQPIFDLKLAGENVPLARSPGMILRGTPAITLKTDNEGVTTIGGKLTLNESFFTKDLASFQQGGGGGAAAGGGGMRPPYFSIQDAPLADWRLHLQIEGDRFLRVRVPTFEGVVSADFNLRGPLRNPFMYGQAELEQGIVMFPFATLRIDGGAVEISQNEPDEPTLNVTASGRAYGYDLQMRVTGTASAPIITFNSTPSLEQSDIILMITSGQIPDHARSTESRLSGIGMYIGRSFLVDLGLIDPLDETLTVNVGEDVSTSGKDTINIRYKINDDWDAVGAYDKYDAYYLDFEWNIYRD
ncbi:translocation/assembly module TamB domain-containing protein [Cerasicoccus fimbriatus]|uniref:translocation/assembly module TamB domain-containing protein n=1 Tax=Cerasicoccus fimbriatus TaxID=3014554 RepID=UPI0022B33CF3|nr:translocation/assembly module TamB domain-containing protein [Cerasicoccus sp. TK19100]